MRIEIDGIALLTESELQVMMCIWEYNCNVNSPIVMQLVNERFNHNWTQQTLSTFITRMRNKGFLSLERKGRTWLYKAEISKEAYREVIATRFAGFWFDGDKEAASEYFRSL